MRKTQVALAALALVASTAALADGVTIYGTLEGAVANTSGNGSYFSGAGGWVAGNNIGFKGSEDLGGGLKANFDLQAGLDLNGYANNGGATYGGTSTSQNGAGLFSRQASVGLSSGELGSINLGRQLSPFVLNHATTGTLGNGHFFVNRLILGGGVAAPGTLVYEGFWVDNAITYATPNIGGWTASIMQQMKNGNTNGSVPAGATNDKYMSLAANGNVAGINVGLAYDNRSETYKTYALNANTKLGSINVAGSYMSSKPQASADINSFSLEAGYDLTDALTVMAQYGENNAATKQRIAAISARYALSKRTFAYASYLDGKNVNTSFDTRSETATTGSNTTVVGVAHSF